MPKNSSTSEDYNLNQCQSLHHLQPQSDQSEQFPNQLHKQQNDEKHKHDLNHKMTTLNLILDPNYFRTNLNLI